MMFVVSILVLAGSLSAGQLDNSSQNAETVKSALPADTRDIKTLSINIISVDDILSISQSTTEAIASSVLDITIAASAMLLDVGYDGISDVLGLGSDTSEYIFEGFEATNLQIDLDAIAAITFADSVTGTNVSDIEMLDIFGPAY
jgi:hypothetical protein